VITIKAMEDNGKLIGSLLETAFEYGKTSFELAKRNAIDKTSDVFSTVVFYMIVFFVGASFLLFLNLGLAFWLGVILGKVFLGFFLVAAFYGLSAIIIYLIFHKSIKNGVREYFIKQALK
jgi:hypothetical protein